MKKLLQLSLVSLVSLSVSAQTTINGSDVNPSVGDSYTDNSSSYLSPGNSGANQTWDFSSLTSSGTATTNVSSASSNGSNMMLSSSSADAYYSITSSAQEIKQIYANNTMITYSNGEKTLQFPLSYNASYSDTFRATFMSGGTYPAVRAGSNTLDVDAYGTLILPGQTITDVIRVHFQQDYADTIDIGTPYIITYVSDMYVWYKAGFNRPILSMSSFNGGGVSNSYGFYTTSTSVGIDDIEAISELKIYGNPVVNNLRFSIQSDENLNIDYQLLDLSGSIVYASNKAQLKQGSNTFTIPTADLAAGIYALKISSGMNSVSKLIVKE